MSYYETVEDIEESEGEEVDEESEVEEEVIVPKRRKVKKWKVRLTVVFCMRRRNRKIE